MAKEEVQISEMDIYAKLSKIAEPKYGFKVVRVSEENIFSTEE